MWFLTLLFFGYQFILRLMPGLVMEEVVTKFKIDAGDYGILSSMYYWAYAPMQIPIALFLDRYKPRYVLGFCTALVSLATLLFVYTESWTVAIIARFLVGAGSAGAFLGVSKVISLKFPENKYSLYVSLSFSFGLSGAIFGGKPVAKLVEALGWVSSFSTIAFFGLGLSILLFFTLNTTEKEAPPSSNGAILSSLKGVLRRPLIWLLAISNLLMVGPLEGFADVWGVTYLMKIFTWSKIDAAFTISLVSYGMILGGPLLALLGRLFKSEPLVIVLSGFSMGALLLILFLSPENYSPDLANFGMFTLGVLCCYQVLIFSVGTRMVPQHEKSMTVAFLNGINMLGGAFYHSLVGYVLNKLWDGTISDGLKVYSAENYGKALTLIPFGCFIGALCIFALSKNFKRSALH